MKKPLALAALSGLILVGAAYPGPSDRDDRDSASSAEGGERYRPCRSRRDDNCIQLYERGVRAAYARWLRDGDPGYEEAVRYAAVDDRRYGRRGPHDHGRDDMRGAHRNHAPNDGHHGRDADRRGHHAHDGHRGHGADYANLDRGDHRARHAALGTRCEDNHARPARAPRQAVRPAPRPHMHEDSGVRGM